MENILLSKIKSLDAFGTGISWRVFSKECYQSYFGSIVTLILYAFFIVKMILFAEKINNYGFANDTVLKGFFDKEYQVTNFEDFKLTIFAPEIKKFAEKYKDILNYEEKDIEDFKLKDYLKLDEYAFNKRLNSKLKMKETDCKNFKRLGDFPDNQYDDFICFDFEKGFDFFNISKKNTFVAIDEEKEIYTNEQIRDLDFFEFKITYTKKFYDFLNKVPESPPIEFLLENFDVDYSNYSLEIGTRAYKYIPELLLKSHMAIDMHKLTAIQIFDLDFIAPELLRMEKFSFPLHGFRKDYFPRDIHDSSLKPYSEKIHYDIVEFDFDVFEELHKVNYLTLDDILSVVGG